MVSYFYAAEFEIWAGQFRVFEFLVLFCVELKFRQTRLYLSPLEGAKPLREGDRHSPYYANMRLEFIN